MKFRTRTAIASAVVAVVAFGSVATASAFGVDPYGHDQPGQQAPVPATRTNGASSPVHKELVTVTPCRVSDTRANGGAKLAPGAPASST